MSAGLESAGRALAEACRASGLDSSDAVLLRLGSNAVYSLPSARVIVRIGPSTSDLRHVDRVLAVARWLEAADFPATRLVPDLRQPLHVDGRAATFWVSVQDQEEHATPPEVADLVRELHHLKEPQSLPLPTYDPLDKWNARIAALTDVPAQDAEFLTLRADELRDRYQQLDFTLPHGVIHADASVGNAIRDRDGRAILIDLDTVARGPREWDLVQTAMYYERYGWHTREQYKAFVSRYGFDVTTWPGYPVLADLRELLMVAWLGEMLNGGPKARAEYDKRITTLRTHGTRRHWRPL